MIINAWLIASRKTAANLTFSKWKRLTTGRQKRGKGLTNASQSVIDHQQAMTETVALFSLIASAVKIGFKQFNSSIGNYAAWIKNVMDNAWDFSTPGSPALAIEDLVIAKGSMPNTVAATIVADASDNSVVITYPTTIGYGQAGTDRIRVAVYNITDSTWYVNTVSTANRTAGTATFTTPAGFLTTADTLRVIYYFEGQPSTATAGKVSDSQNEPETVVA